MAKKKYIRRKIVREKTYHENSLSFPAIDDITQILANFQKRYKYVQFGVTTDYKAQYDKHHRKDPICWSSMRLCYKTEYCLEAENFIVHTRDFENYIDNNIKFPETLFDEHPEYYVYVMVGRRKKPRMKIKTINIGTLFSGIGAIEQALIRMGLKHKNIFACDNGEIELELLDEEREKEYKTLKKIASYRITKEERERLAYLTHLEQLRITEIATQVANLPTKAEKRQFVDELYRMHSKGYNYVKDTYIANYIIDDDDFHLDVHFLDGRDYTNQVDLMVGGSPCQSFSSNGKRGGFEDTRGTLFHDYARIISEVRPRCFIFENVRGMLVHDGGNTWNTIKNTFRELDYNIYLHKDKNGNESPLLNACDYGIPQNRERIYLVGIRNDIALKHEFEFPEPIKLTRTNKDFLEDTVDAKYYLGQKGFEFVTTHPTRAQVGRDIQKCQKANQQFNWNGDFIFEPLSEKHTPEILQRAYIGNWQGQRGVIRMYTPKECLRLMGFPDTFVRPHNDNIMWRQSGNSIVVDVLIALMNELIKTGIFDE